MVPVPIQIRNSLQTLVSLWLFVLLGVGCQKSFQLVGNQQVSEFESAIQMAIDTDQELRLNPGSFLVGGRKSHKYKVGDQHLVIRGASKAETILKRADFSIGAVPGQGMDSYYGAFFEPAPPTEKELQSAEWAVWKEKDGTSYPFTVLVRGRISIENLTLDCNMHQQGIKVKDEAEHSAMLGFAGRKYQLTSGPFSGRTVYIAFEEVRIENIHSVNGGYADDIWVSRGYFRPNIRRCTFRNISDSNRVSPRRGTITFSSPAQHVSIEDCAVYKIELEESSEYHWKEAPHLGIQEGPAEWTMRGVTVKRLDLGSKGQSVAVEGKDIQVTGSTTFHQIGGTFEDCTFRVLPQHQVINRLPGTVFRNVHWQLVPNEEGYLKGIKLKGQYGKPCIAEFVQNRFTAEGEVRGGQIIDSEYSSSEAQYVQGAFIGCTFDDRFGKLDSTQLARIREKGIWYFDNLERYQINSIYQKKQPNIRLEIKN